MAARKKQKRWRFGLAALLVAGPLAAVTISAVVGAFGPAVRIAVLALGGLTILALLAIAADLIEHGRRKKNDDQA